MISNTAFGTADILLPKEADMSKWAVVACDQYTGEPEYWKATESIVGNEPSSLKLILPEIYLTEEGVDGRIENIHRAMDDYLSKGVFSEYKDALVYVERTQDDGKVRCGIVGAIDLEQYDYSKGSKSQVRATEATVVERIPPRIKVREGAQIELPHIMILIDDENKTVIEPLADESAGMEPLYDFPLMQRGGSIKGWLVDDDNKRRIFESLERLGDKRSFEEKYGESGVLLYAMGDGNHSLATAKEYYERLKRKDPQADMSGHPARYALVELVNLHSEALEFEAIHRIVTGVDADRLLAEMTKELALDREGSGQRLTVVRNGVHTEMYIHKESSKLAVGTLQNFLDRYISENGGSVDYIHGAQVVDELSGKTGCVGFLLPDMAKSELFPTVIYDGALPRKTFSMGHAWDKRYYVEARRITE